MDDTGWEHKAQAPSGGMNRAWARALGNIAPLASQKHLTLPVLLDELAGRFATRIAIEASDHSLTYQALAGRKNQYARWALDQGLRSSEHVCLFMNNCPDYVAIWLGLTQIGLVVALINTHLEGGALLQALACTRARHVVADQQCQRQLEAVRNDLAAGMTIWSHGAAANAAPGGNVLDLDRYAGSVLEDSGAMQVASGDTALLIFTSGTTGLPKAAVLSHYRILEWSFWFAGMMDASTSDRLYICLPLYHSTGGVAALGAMLVAGGTVVLRDHFSATRFWPDIAAARCTIFLYIGELCRYLLHAPQHHDDVRHNLRLCCGNGLQEDVWNRFTERFRIPHILEFYAATEGNVALYNYDGPPGALGRVPAYLAHRFPLALLACDPQTGEPRRNADGHFLRCAQDEPGEAIGRIAASGMGRPGAFEGYSDEAATARKILHDVFTPGDAWFRTGDLMRKDRAGYYYFVDRMGDTFRWKGENVSTAQVAEAIGGCRGVTGVAVYGVAIPGADGRAGMAAITTDEHFSPSHLYAYLQHRLPAYARPKYLRLCGQLQTTATFKPIKATLAREGIGANPSGDAVLVEDPVGATYS
jgi:fatty-acyl-CoA synthase